MIANLIDVAILAQNVRPSSQQVDRHGDHVTEIDEAALATQQRVGVEHVAMVILVVAVHKFQMLNAETESKENYSLNVNKR